MAIRTSGLCLSYGEDLIVKDLDLHVPEGSFCSIIGPNGCGKSTLLKAISGNLKAVSGSIKIKETSISLYEPKKLARITAFLTQSFSIPSQFTVRELVSYGRFPYTNWRGSLGETDYKIINSSMKQTGIIEYADTDIGCLSGGEQQRVRIAMALAQEAEILLLDEPTTHLDISHQFQTLDLIMKLHNETRRTILMVVHDLNQAARYSDYIFVMKDGEVRAEGKPKKILTSKLLRKIFDIEARVIIDEEFNCPFFISARSIAQS